MQIETIGDIVKETEEKRIEKEVLEEMNESKELFDGTNEAISKLTIIKK